MDTSSGGFKLTFLTSRPQYVTPRSFYISDFELCDLEQLGQGHFHDNQSNVLIDYVYEVNHVIVGQENVEK